MNTHHHDHTSGAGVLPFPADRCRPPAAINGPLQERRLATFFEVAHLADYYRRLSPIEAELAIGADLYAGGADGIARILNNNTAAIAALRAALASLLKADRIIAVAADSVLTAAGLPSSNVEVWS